MKGSILLLLVSLLVVLPACCGQLVRIRADPEEHYFLDPDGRVCIFHGVNCIGKAYPWYNEPYMLNDTRLDHLKEWGFNAVRLGSMWSGVEPQEGVYNVTYMAILQDIVQRLADRGIYTFFDMHQDVMSSHYGSYDGIPTWLVDKYPPPTNPYPWPLTGIPKWAMGYLTQACSEGFQHFYDDGNNSIGHWAAFWGFMADNFKGNPNVLGYDLMNEPWIGDFYSDRNLSLPAYAAQMNLVPNYEIIHQAIRTHDSEGLVMYEPIVYGQLSENPPYDSGFYDVPGGESYRNTSAYSFHAYCWPTEGLNSNSTDEERREAIDKCEDYFLRQMFDASLYTVNRTGGGVFLTEFGVCQTYEAGLNIGCDVFMNLADEYFMSWTEWDYSDRTYYDSNGDYIQGKVMYYARPYARAIAGIPTFMKFNITTLEFDFEYTINTAIPSPTEIFIPMMHYSCGFDIQTSANIFWQQGPSPDVVYLMPQGGATTGEVASFALTAGTSC